VLYIDRHFEIKITFARLGVMLIGQEDCKINDSWISASVAKAVTHLLVGLPRSSTDVV